MDISDISGGIIPEGAYGGSSLRSSGWEKLAIKASYTHEESPATCVVAKTLSLKVS